VEEFGDGARILLDRALDGAELAALFRVDEVPGGEVGGHVALGEAAHGDRPVGMARPPQPVAEQIAADNDGESEEGDAGEDQAIAVLEHDGSPLQRANFGRIEEAAMNRDFTTTNRKAQSGWNLAPGRSICAG
jgi:hypothetical protein